MLQEARGVVPADLDGVRLDQAVAALCERSRGWARRVVEVGGVYVDGQRVRMLSRPVQRGQVVQVAWMDPPEAEPSPLPEGALLLQHRGIVVVDKPTGVYVQPARHRLKGTLPDLVARALGLSLDRAPEAVHRLDRETSGLVVMGLDARTRGRLGRLWAAARVEKEYLAVLAWPPGDRPGEGQWREPLEPDPAAPGGMRLAAPGTGESACTDYTILHRSGAFALASLRPRTGRTHQIRVHCASHGYPVLGDGRYAGPTLRALAPRLCLHAWHLQLPREVLGAEKVLEAPVPEDFREVISRLGLGDGVR